MFESYERIVSYSGIKIPGRILIGLSLIVLLAGIGLSLITGDLLYFVVTLLFADLIAGVPYYLGKKKIDEVEENLPEALRQMASVLRSGGTFEVAVREIAVSDYGTLSKEFARMLKEMESGKSFSAALESLVLRIESPFLEKVAVIINDAIRTGGKVADVLDQIGDDIRKLYQVKRERKARTAMQFMFLAVSAAVLGPFLMGVAVGITNFMMSMGKALVASGNLPEQVFLQKQAAVKSLEFILLLFVIIESLLAGIMAAIIRDGKVSSGALIAPIFLLLAYVMFIVGKITVAFIAG